MCQFLLFVLYTLIPVKFTKMTTFSLNSVLEKTHSFDPMMHFPVVSAQDHVFFRNERERGMNQQN